MATTTRKNATPHAPTCADVLADAPEGYAGATNPERAARALGLPNGKGFRRVLRDMGVHVREGDAFGERERAFMLVLWRARGASDRKRIADAYRAGDDAPPVL